MNPQEQAYAFAAMMVSGACMGVAYDLLGLLRRIRGLCAVSDMFFGLLCAVGIVVTALWLRCDAFRLYAFLGAACGLLLYGISVGTAIRRIKRRIRYAMQKGRKC